MAGESDLRADSPPPRASAKSVQTIDWPSGDLFEGGPFVDGLRHGEFVRYHRYGSVRRVLERGRYCRGRPCGVWQSFSAGGQPMSTVNYGENGRALVPLDALKLNAAPRSSCGNTAFQWREEQLHGATSRALRRRWTEYAPALDAKLASLLQDGAPEHAKYARLHAALALAGTPEWGLLRGRIAARALGRLGRGGKQHLWKVVIWGAPWLSPKTTVSFARQMLEDEKLLAGADDANGQWQNLLRLFGSLHALQGPDPKFRERLLSMAIAAAKDSRNGVRRQRLARIVAIKFAQLLVRNTQDVNAANRLVIQLVSLEAANSAARASLHVARGGMYATAGRHKAAIRAYREAVAGFTALNYDVRIAKVLPSLAASLAAVGRSKEAADILARAKSMPKPGCTTSSGKRCPGLHTVPTFD